MLLPRTCTPLLLLLSACATTEANRRTAVAPDRRVTNLRRAATLPWVDDGRCVVREASNEWRVLAERCYHALDLDRVRFRDVTGKCPVAVAPVVIAVGVGVCLLAALELAVEAVVVVGSALVVATAIHEALEASERSSAPERVKPDVRAPSGGNQPSANRRPVPVPEPEGGGDVFPPKPPDVSDPPDRNACIPKPVPPSGGDELHNYCAKHLPGNAFPGADVLVNGKKFDGLQPLIRTLWEIKTDNFANYSEPLKGFAIEKEVTELRREHGLAQACGFEFRIGVRGAAHKEALGFAARELEPLIVIMDWC
jgi:hypothetical protein